MAADGRRNSAVQVAVFAKAPVPGEVKTRLIPLLGALPEFDSMAAVTILGALEEHFGIVVHDDEVDGSIFATVGSLCGFVEAKLGS